MQENASNQHSNPAFAKNFLFLLLLATLIFTYRYITNSISQGIDTAGDFKVFFKAAGQIAQGINPYIGYKDYYVGMHYHPYLYPPFFLFLLLPIAHLSYNAALATWFGLQLFLFALGLRFYLSKNGYWQGINKPAAIILSLPFILNTLICGQTGLLTAALFFTSFSLLKTKPYLAGFIFAFILFKPQLLLLLPFIFLASKAWKAAFSFTLTTIVLVAVSAIFFGLQLWQGFFAALELHSLVMQSMPEYILPEIPSPYVGLRILGLSHQPAITLQAIIAITAAIYIYLAFRSNKPQPELAFFPLIFLVSPYSFLYDMPVFAPILIWLMAKNCHTSSGRIMLILASFMPMVGVQIQILGIPVLPILTALLMLFIIHKREV